MRMAPIWGVRVVGISDGTDTARPGGKNEAARKGITNEEFLDDLHARIRRGLGGRFEDGFRPGGSCYGFRTIPVPHPSGKVDRWGRLQLSGHRLEPHPEQAPVIRRIFTEAAAGVSPRDICAGLDRDAVPKPCAGYQFTKAASRARGRWNPPSVLSMLKDERFQGLWRWQQTICVARDPDTGRKVMRAAPEGEALEQHRPGIQLVDDRTWVKVQEILAARAEGVRRDPKTGRLAGREKGQAPPLAWGKQMSALAGLVTCAECGGPVCVIQTRAGGDGRLVRYAGCNRRHLLKARCGNAGVFRLADLEAALNEALTGFFSDTKLAGLHFRRFMQALQAHRTRLTADEERARADLAGAEAEIAKVRQAILAGVVGETTATMLRDGEAKQRGAQERMAAAEEARLSEPRLVPPQEIVARLKAQRIHERREAYQHLLAGIRVRSERRPGKMVRRWVAEIVPRGEAGITGLPKAVAFGKGFITVGPSTSGRGALPLVAAVVPEGVAREQPAHELRQPLGPTAQQQVGVVREEGPGVERRPGGRGEVAQSRHERLAVLFIGHDLPAFQPPEDDVVHRAGGIEPRLSGHRGSRRPVWGAERIRNSPLSQQRPALRVPGEERPHAPGEGAAPRPGQQVSVVGRESPRVHHEGPGLGQGRDASHEVGRVAVVPEDGPAFDPPHHHVVQDPGGIQPWSAWHDAKPPHIRWAGQVSVEISDFSRVPS
jgi:hypothetical protein